MLPWLEKFAKELPVIEQAPISFALAVLICTSVGWLILRWLYRERLDAANSLVSLYKDKFGPLSGVAQSPMERMTNRKLKQMANQVAQEIGEMGEVLAIYPAAPGTSDHVRARYEKEFKADAILCRAEMKSRLSKSGIADPGSPVGMGPSAYESPTNAFGFREVTSDLRRLSKLLPRS